MVGRAMPRHNLPPQPTPFVGRQTDLAQIAARLSDHAGLIENEVDRRNLISTWAVSATTARPSTPFRSSPIVSFPTRARASCTSG